MAIEIYTDGACSGNGKTGAVAGCGVYFPNKEYTDISIKVPKDSIHTNNVAELLAVLLALDVTAGDEDIVIYSDSKYVVQGINTRTDNWIKESRIKSQANWQMFLMAKKLLSERTGITNIIHIGRSSKPGNIVADSLAVSAKDKEFPEWSIKKYWIEDIDSNN